MIKYIASIRILELIGVIFAMPKDFEVNLVNGQVAVKKLIILFNRQLNAKIKYEFIEWILFERLVKEVLALFTGK